MESTAFAEALKTRSGVDGIALAGDTFVAPGETITKSASASLPSGVCAEFTATITTTKKDRDADILESRGANVDPKMALLWQHNTAEPIGKLVEIVERSNDRIVCKFQIADTELGRDAATLVEMGALRLSVGFRPTDVEPIKGTNGFHVRGCDIYETSLVSVPANPDCVIDAFRSNKFLSSTIKAWAASLPNATTTKGTENVNTTTTETKTTTNPNPATVFGGNNPRVKAPSERFNSTKSVGKHVRSGEVVKNFAGNEAMLPSELELAKAGVFFKRLAMKSGHFGSVTLEQHEKELWEEMVEKDAWCGQFGNTWETSVTGDRVKALLSDSTSGGSEINPVWFDDAAITYPLLHSELLPYVDSRSVPRGSSVEGAAIGNPSVSWGTAEGTSINLFDTQSLVSEINTTIHPVQVGLEVGRDLMADSAVDIGRVLLENIGQKMLAELDDVIANGNGTDRPEGIFTASGLSTPGSTNGNGGPITIADLESLVFGVAKQYRNAGMRCAFLFNDVVYKRCRGIQVGTSDQRRVLGMDHQSYNLLEYPVRIQNSIANTKMAFGAMAKYRLYRRAGMEQRFIDGGVTLARKNCVLLIVRGRFGGRVVDPSAFCKITDAQS